MFRVKIIAMIYIYIYIYFNSRNPENHLPPPLPPPRRIELKPIAWKRKKGIGVATRVQAEGKEVLFSKRNR